MTSTQVVNRYAFFILQLADCTYVSLCQIHYMNVVADTGSVWSVVIIAEYMNAFSLANCYLGNIRYQVVWNSLRILADSAALMEMAVYESRRI